MSSQDRALDPLLELGTLGRRRTRSGQIEHSLRTALALTDADAAVVLLPSGRRGERLVMHAGSGATAILPISKSGSEALRSLAQSTEPLQVTDLMDDARWTDDACPGVESGPVLFVALQQRDPTPGYLAVYRRRGRARFAAAEVRCLVMLSAWLGLSLDQARRATQVEKRSVTDDLTEVYNERFFKAALRRELRRAGRFGQEMSLAQVILDPIRTAPGQETDPSPTRALRELAILLSRQVRSFDLLARRGDDEFMLILPQTGQAGALEAAERFRAAVEQHAFSAGPAGSVTVSIGVASFPREGADERSLIASVERAQAQAREHGPNRVETLDRRAA